MYNNYGELMGVPPKAAHRGSRGEFLQNYHKINPNIQSELEQAKMRLGDTLVYSIKRVGPSTTIKMFETQDDKQVGLRSLSNAKLPKNQTLLLSGIYVLAGTAPAATQGSPSDDEIMATPFGSVTGANYSAITNGEFDLKVNKVQLVPETSCRVFCTDNDHNWPLGYYKLHNPRTIDDDVLIEATFTLGTTQNIPADTYLFLGLHGTITTP